MVKIKNVRRIVLILSITAILLLLFEYNKSFVFATDSQESYPEISIDNNNVTEYRTENEDKASSDVNSDNESTATPVVESINLNGTPVNDGTVNDSEATIGNHSYDTRANVTQGIRRSARSARSLKEGWQTEGNKVYYYLNGERLKGIHDIGGNLYYFEQYSGELVKSSRWIYYNGNTYHSDANGVLYKNRFIHYTTYSEYYLDNQGRVVKYPFYIGQTYYRPNADTGEIIYGARFIDNSDGTISYIDENGIVKKGAFSINGKLYIADSNGKIKKSSWINYNGYTYHSDATGALYRNRFIHYTTYSEYYLDNQGRVVKYPFYIGQQRYIPNSDSGEIYYGDRFIENSDGTLSYVNSNGTLATGYFSKNDKKYIADSNGKIKKSSWITYKGDTYHSDPTGALYTSRFIHYTNYSQYYLEASGRVKKEAFWIGKTNYIPDSKTGEIFNEKYVGFVNKNGKTYYYNSNGKPSTGLFQVSGKKYIASVDGAIKKSTWTLYKGDWYLSSKDGYLYANMNVHFNDECFYYFDADAKLVTKPFFIGNKYYIPDSSSGAILYNQSPGFYKTSLGLMYIKSDKTPGIGYYCVGQDYYIADEKGVVLINSWIKHDGGWYHSDSQGRLYRDRFLESSKITMYYLDTTGRMVTEPFQKDGIRYVPNPATGEITRPESQPTKLRGWVKDGNSYKFYDANGKMLTGHQDINGYKYFFDNSGYLQSQVGIDISVWNPVTDWSAVRNSGVEVAIIRSSGTFAGSGKLYNDSKMDEYIVGAQKVGIEVGLYHYSQAITEAEARNEARYMIERAKKYNITRPLVLDMEIYSDSDGVGRTGYLSKGQNTAIANAFLDEVNKAGYQAMYYSYTSFMQNNIDMSKVDNKYPVWVAQYYDRVTYDRTYSMWQYTSQGKVPGISGNVDLNVVYNFVMKNNKIW